VGFFRNLFGGSIETASAPGESAVRIPRRSTGFNQFTRAILRPDGQRILDLGSTSSSNINYITGLGHRAYNEDLLMAASASRLAVPGPEEGSTTVDVERFLAEDLLYEPESFDAVLFWDVCDYLPEPLVKPVVERIYQITKPHGALLAFFHTKDAGAEAPYYRYHIKSAETLELQPGPHFQLQRVFQNRHVENLFHDYNSIKFFLGKENIREVLLVR
jgi:2-polyprenyl-3-methyl-5-hydroxy-6-metoxy-1,4-benzoquinol methylase